MQFAEVFLRLGLSLVAWMFVFAYMLWLAVLRQLGCEQSGDEMHRLLLGVAPFVIAFSFALRLTRPLGDVHRILRWFGVPVLLLLPLGVLSIWEVSQLVHGDGRGICTPDSLPRWAEIWPAAQLLTVACIVWAVWVNFRDTRRRTAEPKE